MIKKEKATLVKNAYIENDSELKDIRIKDGVFEKIGKL